MEDLCWECPAKVESIILFIIFVTVTILLIITIINIIIVVDSWKISAGNVQLILA